MKLIVIAALALVAVVVAAPAEQSGKVVTIVRSAYEHSPDGGYNFNYETDDGTSRSENGELNEVNDAENKPHKVLFVRGSYSYVDNEGKTHSVDFVADDNGFRPQSDDIPQPQA